MHDPNAPGAVVVAHIAHVIERNSSVASLADLPPGHIAARAVPDDPWFITAHHWEDNDSAELPICGPPVRQTR